MEIEGEALNNVVSLKEYKKEKKRILSKSRIVWDQETLEKKVPREVLILRKPCFENFLICSGYTWVDHSCGVIGFQAPANAFLLYLYLYSNIFAENYDEIFYGKNVSNKFLCVRSRSRIMLELNWKSSSNFDSALKWLKLKNLIKTTPEKKENYGILGTRFELNIFFTQRYKNNGRCYGTGCA
jgi:hypothetical protein